MSSFLSRIVSLLVVVLLGCSVGAYAQESAQANAVRELNAQVLRLQARLQQAPATEQTPLLSSSSPVLTQRFQALRALIEEDPRAALQLAFSPDLIAGLAQAFPQSRGVLEAHGSFQGGVEYLVLDGVKFTTSKSVVNLNLGKEKVSLYFADPRVPGFKSGDMLWVRGVRAGDRMAVEEVRATEMEAPPVCSTTGGQKIAVILANLKSYTLPANITESFVKGVMLGNAAGGGQSTPDYSVNDFWMENSDGQTWVNQSGSGALTVVGPYKLAGDYNTNGGCDYTALLEAATAAADGDLNYQDFSRTMVIFPLNNGCSWAGLGTLGCWSSYCPGDGACNLSWVLERSDQMWSRWAGVHLSSHELGHNLNLHHSSSRQYATETLGPLGYLPTIGEYGDYFATMGGWNVGFYNADQAIEVLGWLKPTTNYLDVSTSGSYSIPWYGTRPAGLKALRIQRGSASDNAKLIVESHQNRNIYDANLGASAWKGALIHYRDAYTGTKSHLLDFSPGDFYDPTLAVGKTWTDPYTNLSIKVDSIVDDKLNVTVTYGAGPCTRADPTVSLSPSNPSVSAGSSVTYTVSVKNNDSESCGPATFVINSVDPFGWPFGTLSPEEVTVNPGATGTVSLTKTPPIGTELGTYTVSATAATAVPLRRVSGTASCTVVSARMISGQVLLDGSAMSGVTMTLSGSQIGSTQTDGSGSYSFVDLPHGGSYTVTLSQATYAFTPTSQVFGSLNTDVIANFTAVPAKPEAPASLSPANAATGVELTPTLVWGGGSGATSYDVYFGATSPPPFVTNSAGNTYSPGTLSGSKKYYWKVVAKNSGGSTVSALWAFTTQAAPQPPAKPAGPSPANNAKATALPVVLKWSVAARATSYDVYFGTSPSPPLVGNVTVPTFKPDASLVNTGTTYFWIVVAKNAAGTATSATWTFKTKPTPNAPANPNPSNFATGVSRTIELEWNAAAGATSYDVYFGTTSTLLSKTATNVNGTTFTPASPLLAKKKYFWKVVAKSGTGQQASPAWSFITK